MRSLLLIILCFALTNAYAREPEKKPLSIGDFNTWKTLTGSTISDDGNAVAFIQKPQRGDGILIITRKGEVSDTIPRANNVQFDTGSNIAVFRIGPSEEQLRVARRNKVKKDKMPGDTLGILLFNKGSQLLKFPHLKSYEVPEDDAGWVVFSLEQEVTGTESASDSTDSKQNGVNGDRLVLFEVATADTVV